MKSYLKWENLKDNKCPQCGRAFENFRGEIIYCDCGFKIGQNKLKNIIADMTLRESKKENDKKADKILEGYGIE